MLKLNEIYFEDCLIGMDKIDDKSIDMVLCDLPYGTTQNKWDVILPFHKLWAHYLRVAKDNAAIVLTASQPFTSLAIMSNIKMFKYSLVWDKKLSTGFLNAKKQFLRTHEDILVFYAKQPTYNPQFFFNPNKRKMAGMNLKPHSDNYGSQKNYISTAHDNLCYPISIIESPQVRGNSLEKVNHPTQKPLSLFEYLIKTYSNEGDIILDNCVGSGTTAVACINTKRNFIVFENSEKYYPDAKIRIDNAKSKKEYSLNI